MRTEEWKIMWKKIITAKDATFAVFSLFFFQLFKKSLKKIQLSFRNCKSCVYNCDDLLSYKESAISQTSSLNFRDLSSPSLTFQCNSIHIYICFHYYSNIYKYLKNKGAPKSREQFLANELCRACLIQLFKEL